LREYGMEIRLPVASGQARALRLGLPRISSCAPPPARRAWSRAGAEFGHWSISTDWQARRRMPQPLQRKLRPLHGRLFVHRLSRVKPDFQGRGLGRSCCATPRGRLQRRTTEATLTTDSTNFAALNLLPLRRLRAIDLLFEFQQTQPDGILKIRACKRHVAHNTSLTDGKAWQLSNSMRFIWNPDLERSEFHDRRAVGFVPRCGGIRQTWFKPPKVAYNHQHTILV